MTGKFYDKVGYVDTVETAPSVFEEQVIHVQNYYGDVIHPSIRYRGAEKLNDDIVTQDKISILSDAFAYENFSKIRFVRYLGSYWKVSDISVQAPRLILTLGGVYNGPTSRTGSGDQDPCGRRC